MSRTLFNALGSLSALTFACSGVVNRMSQHRVAQLPDWRLLGPGHCGPTAASERCDVGQHGASVEHERTKITSLEQCAARCYNRCASCAFVSFSEAHKDCSWYARCDTPGQLEWHGNEFVSAQVRGVPALTTSQPPPPPTSLLAEPALLARSVLAGPYACSEESYQRIESLASALSRKVMAAVGSYVVHGHYGLFNREYGEVKTRFIWQRLCSQQPLTICETGFNAGLSALLMLEAAPSARLVSFDLGDLPWSGNASALLRGIYPRERFLGVVFGDSMQTIPKFAAAHPTFRCDAILLDGGKAERTRMADLKNLRAMASPGARVYMDEVNSKACVDGSLSENDWEAQCRLSGRLKFWHGTAPRAYHTAASRGLMRVRSCEMATAAKNDGVCEAEYL